MKTILCKSFNDPRIGFLKAVTAFVFAVILQIFLTSAKIELPQKNGQSLLSLVSDDTRMVLSSSMLKKADDYFHGGASAEGCTLEIHASEALSDDHEHDHHDHEEPDHQRINSAALKKPFLWINSQIHSQEHRHLQNEKSVELLPWVSAAVMASPHNIQAYESGSYILNRMVGKPDLAIEFLGQGIKNNPENASLELSISEIYFNTLKDKKNAAVHLNQALKKNLEKKGDASEEDLFERLRIYYYLGVIAKDDHDIEKLRILCQRAGQIDKNSVMTHSLIKRLNEELQNKKE